jgi:UDP-N-acetylglucosamine 2-epimerase (non-hydrolysing)
VFTFNLPRGYATDQRKENRAGGDSVGVSIAFVIGTRPEAIKLAPVVDAARRAKLPVGVVTTGQHPDLLPPTLRELGLVPDVELSASRLNEMVGALQGAIKRGRSRLVVVQGDTRTAMAGALAAKLSALPLAHVEAGLRTGNHLDPFPEELFRTAIGRLADLHFAPTPGAADNLKGECVGGRIEVVGNPVIDSLTQIAGLGRPAGPAGNEGKHILITVHRAENEGARLTEILGAAAVLAAEDASVTVIRHPRLAWTRMRDHAGPSVRIVPPLPHSAFIDRLCAADLVISDSGGVQEEAARLGKRMIVCRNATERPEALAEGERILVPPQRSALVEAARALLASPVPTTREEAFGDGRSGQRIAEMLADHLMAAC